MDSKISQTGESHTQPSWKELLAAEKEKSYFKAALSRVESDRKSGIVVYPKNSDIFNALQFTSFADLKVVILGQDPYHGPNQAHGLCFSVQRGIEPPPSLVNIFKELKSDLGVPMPNHGYLEKWARQGVLLLNTVLTVQAGKPLSHREIGWETFTDKVISIISQHKKGVVFLLWGSPAQKKSALIDGQKHHILTAPHPSPLSAHRGFLGCKHFSKTNALLKNQGLVPIDWSLDIA